MTKGTYVIVQLQKLAGSVLFDQKQMMIYLIAPAYSTSHCLSATEYIEIVTCVVSSGTYVQPQCST